MVSCEPPALGEEWSPGKDLRIICPGIRRTWATKSEASGDLPMGRVKRDSKSPKSGLRGLKGLDKSV
ncbi:hypothetical protein CEXT_396321 [Caerostris extrusa]|uniref:Uncharacterized protein n=1 Tax=Caerostris extrusa TaxID=172846 RepID=A0AAV4RY59_CAEEX|nr:hypothetical protein CEXT_396321 [Caerostris extrusa]